MASSKITFGVNLSVDNYWDVPEFARRAEDLGYGRVTMGEHIMDGNPPRPTLLNLPAMAAAAGATTNLRVMTGIVVAPLYDPVILAKMVASVDQVSGGRLDFGIGISGQRGTKIEFDAVGVDVHTRGKRTDEMLQVMKRLWTEEHVSHHGDFFHFDDVTLLPFPAQKPYPAIWVSGRSEAAMRRAGVMGDGWYPYLFSVRRVKASNDMVRQYAAEAGRDLTGFHWGLNQPTAISSDASEALALAVSNVGERYVTPERSAESIARSLCIAGTPEDCIKAVEDRVDAGVEHINLGFLASEPDSFFRQMEMFASHVMPQFQA
ncbi:MAG: LLM class F420-dependent oxidoreductase [Chloroflexi bacterium]|jgi:probable F420-dependent oxidoreductase|nr:LLM class F420-dependent oxidoreductase [Chloroflexota bacterium]MDP6497568.1 LLM class flavin-dependent oxidoreductase [Dehalococcoidia bacterium]MQG54647.1 LLM class flavin-dependent oxidoreductase [SAR202 cluster bacterium]|tara:strand:- start:21471 stop:22427 length:957 start_codon:yes stop_codon:yes gene_type:complete